MDISLIRPVNPKPFMVLTIIEVNSQSTKGL